MTTIKTLNIRAEADTIEELSTLIECLKKEYGMIHVLDLPHGDEKSTKAYVQNIEAIRQSAPRNSN